MNYLSYEQYRKLFTVLQGYTAIILLSLGEHSTEIREQVIRNFIARGVSSLESIFIIWETGNYQDAWALHRILVERLFHIHALATNNEFEVFNDWSFMMQHEAKNALLSDQSMRVKLPKSLLKVTPEQKARYKLIKAQGLSWSRPKAEQVAKAMKLPFLYRYSYDFASTHVHPMADDGEEDFLRLVGILKGSRHEQITLLHNSILLQVLLINNGINASRLSWRTVIFNFLDQIINALEKGDTEYELTFRKIIEQGPDFRWCMPDNSDVRKE